MKSIVSKECSDLLFFEDLLAAISAPADRCDWSNCSEIGVFDGLNTDVLTAEARKNFKDDSRFVFLCPKHFTIAMANLNVNDV